MTIEFIEVKVSDLGGEALNWAVAKACGIDIYRRTGGMISDGEVVLMLDDHSAVFAPYTDWSQGGPLIETFRVDMISVADGNGIIAAYANDSTFQPITDDYYGPTHLIAACRAIVASVLGDTVPVPKELCHE